MEVWSASQNSHCTLGKRAPGTLLNRWLGGPQSWSGSFGKEQNHLTVLGIKPWILRSAACSLVTIPGTLKHTGNFTLILTGWGHVTGRPGKWTSSSNSPIRKCVLQHSVHIILAVWGTVTVKSLFLHTTHHMAENTWQETKYLNEPTKQTYAL